jgi:hypothetical protein
MDLLEEVIKMEYVALFLVFLVVVYKIFKMQTISILRDNLFVVRNQYLFPLPRKHKGLKYESELYKMLELLINSTIQYAHKISFTRIGLFIVLNEIRIPGYTVQDDFRSSVESEIEGIRDHELKDEINDIIANLDAEIIRYFMKTSVLFWIFIAYSAIKESLASKQNGIREKIRKGAEWAPMVGMGMKKDSIKLLNTILHTASRVLTIMI